MGAGTKILAGCGCLAIVAGLALAAGLGFGLFWLEDRATDIAGGLKSIAATSDEIEEWEEKANAQPYERPDGGVIPESRLTAFLGVRREVHGVYETCKADLEELRERAQGDPERLSPAELLTIAGTTARMFGDLRLAQVRALAENEMSEQEYYAIQTAVYLAAGASKTEEGTGRMPAEAMSEATRQVQEAMRAGLEMARQEGVPGVGGVSESDVKRLEEGLEKVGTSGAEALAIPPANVELFRKHEADIQKYAMHGLAFLGL